MNKGQFIHSSRRVEESAEDHLSVLSSLINVAKSGTLSLEERAFLFRTIQLRCSALQSSVADHLADLQEREDSQDDQ